MSLAIRGAPVLEMRGRLAGYALRFQKRGDMYWALVGFDPWVRPGTYTLDIESVDAAGARGQVSVPVVVAGASFPEESVVSRQPLAISC